MIPNRPTVKPRPTSRSSIWTILIFLVVGLLDGLLGCDNYGNVPRSSSQSNQSTDSTSQAGIFSGTLTSTASGGQADPAFALFLPDGSFRALSGSMLQASGTLNFTAATGTALLYAPAAFQFGDTQSTASITLSGSTTSQALVAGTYQGGDTGTFQLNANAAANAQVQMSDLAGVYSADAAATASGQPTGIAVSATGALTGGDPLGTLTGQLTQVAAAANGFNNAFSATLTYTPRAAGSTAQSFSGLAFQSPSGSGSSSPGLVLMLDMNQQQQFAGIFEYQGSLPSSPVGAIPTGVWSGLAHSDASNADHPAKGLILDDGTLRIWDTSNTQFTGTLSLAGGALTGPGFTFAPAPDLGSHSPITLTSTLVTDNMLDLNFNSTILDPLKGTMTFTHNAADNFWIAPEQVIGSFSAPATATATNLETTLKVTNTSAGLTLTVVDEQSTLSGTMSQITPWVNAFAVTLDYTASISGNTQHLTGLAFVQGSPVTSLTLMLDNSKPDVDPTTQYSGNFAYVGPPTEALALPRSSAFKAR